MSSENEEIIQRAYQRAEDKDIEAFIGCFTDDGTFTDQSIGVTYRGNDIGDTVVNYAVGVRRTCGREVYQGFYSTGNIGRRPARRCRARTCGALKIPGWNAQADRQADRTRPVADVFELVDGKIKRISTCYPSEHRRAGPARRP